jgi:hypothetical protein
MPEEVTMKTKHILLIGVILVLLFFTIPTRAQGDDPSPPSEPVKLIFIHHSTGENWLQDDYGGLGRELAANNYFVSDTNYGWGPDYIGDRTDIVNWREWFVGPDSSRYMQALYDESGQNSYYSRTFSDPGGENQIVMFKSCFPNSALEGEPDDPPDPNEDYTVGHAKYVYNDLLNYFITRPDKLFIVITAPPLQDPEYADNARAFNNWLVFDWLAENDYLYSNVAVFDFYNVLTHPDNHHRFNNGQIEHVIGHATNTLYYNSDDDHPNVEGSQKATQEFIPLLNVYYHRWINAEPGAVPVPISEPPPEEEGQTPPEGDSAPEDQPQPIVPLPPSPVDDVIDDFEGPNDWGNFCDEATPTQISCDFDADKAIGREQSLHIDFDVAPNSWASCTLLYDSPQDWSRGEGLAFFYNASAPGLLFEVTVHSGSPETLTSYQFTIETAPDSTDNWIPFELTWDQILGVDWEADVGNPIDPTKVTGVAISFGTFPDTPNTGTLWIDSLRLLGVEPAPEAQPPQQEAPPAEEPVPVEQPQPTEVPPADQGGGRMPCPGTTGLGLMVFLGFFWISKRRH